MKFVSTISIEDRNHLNKLIRSSLHFRTRQRAHAIILSEKKFPVEIISDIFEVHRDTISRWIDLWEEKGINGIEDAPKPGRPKRSTNRILAKSPMQKYFEI